MVKIVHIEDFFHPDAGYQINVLAKFQAVNNYDVTIITGEMEAMPRHLIEFFGSTDIVDRDKEFTARTKVKILRVPVIKYYSGRAIYTPKIFKIVQELAPDILYVHGNDTFAGIVFTIFNRWFAFPLIMDNHMLEMASVNRFNKIFRWSYSRLVSPVLIKNKIKVIRVVDDDYVINKLQIPRYLSPIINLGTDTIQFRPDIEKRKQLRKIHDIQESEFVILYIGKITSDKGVKLLAEACKEKLTTKKGVVVVIVGNVSSSYGLELEDILNSSQNRILRFPTQKYNRLPDFYHISDAVVFPKHCSLSFFDAQACGLPVIAESNQINVKRLNIGNGLIFNANDSSDLRIKIEELVNMETERYSTMQESALKYIKLNGYDYSFIERQYHNEILATIHSFKNGKYLRPVSRM